MYQNQFDISYITEKVTKKASKYKNKRNLKGTKIVIKEDLTGEKAKLLKQTMGINNAWPANGSIFNTQQLC